MGSPDRPDLVPGELEPGWPDLGHDSAAPAFTRPAPPDGPNGQPYGTRVARRSRRRPWYATPWVVIVAVTALAGGLRFYHLSSPHAYVFDEVYYAKDGCFDAGYPYQQCKLDSPGEQTVTVHPPLGRWIIALGEKWQGNRPFGWRIMSAIFGTLSVLLVAILALRLWGSVLWAGVAGLLLATESLNFVQSRISMLDIFVTTFVLAGFLFLVLDRQWIERRTPQLSSEQPETFGPPSRPDEDPLHLPPDRVPSPLLRPWRIAAGLAFGAAAATKWSGATALVAALLLAVGWEYGRRRRARLDHSWWEVLRDEGFGILAFLVILPAACYLASYARFWVDTGLHFRPFWQLQQGMASYSIHLRAPHPYSSKAWSWLLLKRPVAYYYQGNKAGTTAAEILGIGNPLIFWGSVLAFPYLAWRWLARQEWRAGFLVVAFAALYLPWFGAARTLFLFYMAPMTPLMVLAVVYVLRQLSEAEIGIDRVRALKPVAVALAVVAVAMFVFFLPVLTGRVISHSAWQHRMWFGICSPKPSWCWI